MIRDLGVLGVHAAGLRILVICYGRADICLSFKEHHWPGGYKQVLNTLLGTMLLRTGGKWNCFHQCLLMVLGSDRSERHFF